MTLYAVRNCLRVEMLATVSAWLLILALCSRFCHIRERRWQSPFFRKASRGKCHVDLLLFLLADSFSASCSKVTDVTTTWICYLLETLETLVPAILTAFNSGTFSLRMLKVVVAICHHGVKTGVHHATL